jgi:hypothetical protein
MSTSSLIITIAPDRDGKHAISVSLRNADGTVGPPQRISVDQDHRIAAFVAAMQAIAGQQVDGT